MVNATLLAAFLYESPLTVLRAAALLVVVTGASPSQHGDRRGGQSNTSAEGVGPQLIHRGMPMSSSRH